MTIKLPELINRNQVNAAFTHISDLMPTFLELAGTEHPSIQNDAIPGMIGKSLFPLLKGDAEAVHLNEVIGYELQKPTILSQTSKFLALWMSTILSAPSILLK